MALPSPEQIARANTEHAHQSALFAQAALYEKQFPELRWLHSIPNGGQRGDNAHSATAVGAYMKAEGLRKGVVDVCLPIARAGFFGFYLEMKKPGKIDQTSKEQDEFIVFVSNQGYAVMVCDNWQAAWRNILWYLQQPTTVAR